MSQSSRYVLATGEEGAHRLHVVHSVHGPDTERFLTNAGLCEGQSVAEIGCGTGNISCWIANQVGPTGRVVGIDISPAQIEQATRNAHDRGIRNSDFEVGAANDSNLKSGTFDIVFCRFVLMHLEDAAGALREMWRLVKPGGVLACEDGDFHTPFSAPRLAAFDRTMELYRNLGAARGQSFDIAERLYRMFLELGVADPVVTLAQPVFVRGEAKRLPEWTIAECAPGLIEHGLSTPGEIAQITAQLETFAADESTMIGMARMTQVWGRKPH